MARLHWFRFVAVLATLMACPSVWADWDFSSNTPASTESITIFGDTTGFGYAPAVGNTADYRFEKNVGGVWKLRNQHTVTAVAGPMGMPLWSQTLSPPAADPDAGFANSWPVTPLNGMGFRIADYRARLLSTNDDISKLNITVTPN